MLLDARGHLKLTDMGLCKKVGEVSHVDEPHFILKALREQGLLSEANGMDVNNQSNPGAGKHRDSGDAMAMSIDGIPTGNNGPSRPQQMPTAKARREVSLLGGTSIYLSGAFIPLIFVRRWRIRLSGLLITSLLKSWRLRTARLDTRTQLRLIGGLWESLCLSA